MCWQSHEERQAQGTGRKSLSQLKFRFQRPAGNGTPETPWNLTFNPLGLTCSPIKGVLDVLLGSHGNLPSLHRSAF